MSLIQVRVIRGVFTAQQKQQIIIERLTEALARG
jgi:phenylpyruvate tautomerase PptA (4-oxalocrotonate tautomerase family)